MLISTIPQEIKSKNQNEITLQTSKISWIKENDKKCWYKFQERRNLVQYWSCHLSFSQKSLVVCSSLIRDGTQHFILFFFYYFYIISAFMMPLFWSCLWSYAYKKLFQSRLCGILAMTICLPFLPLCAPEHKWRNSNVDVSAVFWIHHKLLISAFLLILVVVSI